MADLKNSHIVEIPVDEEHQQKKLAMTTISAIQHHPLMEISQSPGHLLLLKLWQREEDLFGRRISMKETRLNSIKSELFQLCLFFFIFHGFFLTILFTSSQTNVCHKWWIPSTLSLVTSLVIVFLVQMKLCRYWKAVGQLQREKADNRAVVRCIMELRMKGASFDLNKEPHNARKMKSSSVEIKWKPITWFDLPCLQIYGMCIEDSVAVRAAPGQTTRVLAYAASIAKALWSIHLSMKRDDFWSDGSRFKLEGHVEKTRALREASVISSRINARYYSRFKQKVASEKIRALREISVINSSEH